MRGVTSSLRELFEGRDLGPPSLFLGIAISRQEQPLAISINQQHYIKQLGERFGLQHAKPASTPLPAGTVLRATTEQDKPAGPEFAALVGSLMYLSSCTRPDIAHAVSTLARHMANPSHQHLLAACHVLHFEFCSTNEQAADGLTKAQSPQLHRRFCALIGLTHVQY